MKKASKRARIVARTNTLETARNEMNYWRKSYSFWRRVLGQCNKGLAFSDTKMVFQMLNMNRTQLRNYIGAVEIHLGMAE